MSGSKEVGGHSTHKTYKYLYQQWKHLQNRSKARKAKGERCEVLFEGYLDFSEWAISSGWRKGLAVCREGDVGDYSKDNCRIDTVSSNSVEAHAKIWKLLSPDGKTLEVYNLKQFCLDNNLQQSKMSLVMNGGRTHHKGWKRYIG